MGATLAIIWPILFAPWVLTILVRIFMPYESEISDSSSTEPSSSSESESLSSLDVSISLDSMSEDDFLMDTDEAFEEIAMSSDGENEVFERQFLKALDEGRNSKVLMKSVDKRFEELVKSCDQMLDTIIDEKEETEARLESYKALSSVS